MKLITKIHLINWHYIQYKTLEINKGVNFFTGKTGAGKSTVIDAVQLIILGDVKGKYFNKAANDESKRTLIEYLRGMVKDDEYEGKKFRREGDFSSYIVLEVEDTKKKRKFCLGVVFDVRKDYSEPEHQFFCLEEELPKKGFIKNGTPLDIKSLKEEMSGKIRLYSTEEYKEKFLNLHMGKLRKEFYTTFKRSVSFKPPKNIREFINNFVCEEVYIDIDEMRERIRAYVKLQQEMEETNEKVDILKAISEKYCIWNELNEQKKLYDFIIDRCDAENAKNDILSIIQDIEDTKNQIQEKSSRLDILKIELENLDKRKESIEDDIRNSEETDIRQKIIELDEKLKNLYSIKRKYSNKSTEFSKWKDCIKDWKNIFPDDNQNLSELLPEIDNFKKFNLEYNSFNTLNERLSAMSDRVQTKYYKNDTIITDGKNELDNLRLELRSLENGIKKYPERIEIVKMKISEGLQRKYKKQIKVEIIADLIDVKDKEWKNAIEGYMNSQKLYLLVEPQYYDDAIRIYNSSDRDLYYGVGIIDIEKISKLNISLQSGSLGEEITSDNKYALMYTNYLLGKVMKCEDIRKIREYNTSITKDCFLYKNYIATILNPNSYKKDAFIGKDSIVQKMAQVSKDISSKKQELDNAINYKEFLKKYKNLKIYTQNDIAEIIEEQEQINCIEQLEKENRDFKEKLSKIDLFYVHNLKEELELVRYNIENMDKEMNEANNFVIEKSTYVKIKSEIIPTKEKELSEKNKNLILLFNKEWIDNIGEISFKRLLDKSSATNIKNKHEEMLREEILNLLLNAHDKLIEARGIFLEKYILFWDREDSSNEKYDSLLNELVESNLPQYEEKINKQKQYAFSEFKEDLLYKLRDGITRTEEQLKYLNKAIKEIKFGSKKYEFKVKGSKKYADYYKMLTDDLLIMPNSLFSAEFEEKYSQPLEELFSLLAESENKQLPYAHLEEIKNNVKLFTDYRTYLDFDMVEVVNGMSSDLSKIMFKTSGGETQSPFYIAVLASFIQIYRMNKNDDETMRLIMFDEAFSKMDEEHIDISVKLMKELGFQSIIAAPDDKIRVIGPESDKIFVVENIKKENITICDFEKEDKERLLA